LSIETQSKISLISQACVLAGEEPVQSLTEDRYCVTVLANLFELRYEALLQSNRWRFAMKKGAFSRLNVEPLNEYRYAYQIPTDCLLLIGPTYRCDYEIYGDRVYTNNASFEAEYMFKPSIVKLPAHFSLLLVYSLAKDALNPITENDTRVDAMTTKYKIQRNESMFADAQSRPNRSLNANPFTDVRG
jgi:hypothetical protein